jgi:hypothetical protein
VTACDSFLGTYIEETSDPHAASLCCGLDGALTAAIAFANALGDTDASDRLFRLKQDLVERRRHYEQPRVIEVPRV